MDIASDVVELFLTRDPARARELAAKLDSLNQDRRDSEARALDAIDRQLLTLIDADGAYPPTASSSTTPSGTAASSASSPPASSTAPAAPPSF